MKKLLIFLARSLVREPDKVQVDELPSGRQVRYKLRVAPGDVGRIIGKNGRTAKALRTVINALAARDRKRVIVDIVD